MASGAKPSMKMLGAILAGGQSRRFGSDKADARFEGKRLIDLVCAALAPQVAELVICGREDENRLSLADRPESGLGPLGGLSAALEYAQRNGFDCILSAGCDAPDLPENLVDQLSGDTASIVDAQPVIGIWPVRLLADLDRFIADGGRSLYGFADHVGARRVTLDQPVANINRPADLDRLSAKTESG